MTIRVKAWDWLTTILLLVIVGLSVVGVGHSSKMNTYIDEQRELNANGN